MRGPASRGHYTYRSILVVAQRAGKDDLYEDHALRTGSAILTSEPVLPRLDVWTSMSIVSLLLNVLWLLFGGIWMAVGWVIAAVVMAVTIIGLPWARAALSIALYTLLPFGHTVIPRDRDGREDLGTGPLGFVGNLIWLVLAGWWLAVGHIVTAVGLAVTIVGLPFAWAHLKLAGLALWPIGRDVVPVREAHS
jgi:uncharacterized membrane protein YccF (DUF307 family)